MATGRLRWGQIIDWVLHQPESSFTAHLVKQWREKQAKTPRRKASKQKKQLTAAQVRAAIKAKET